MEEKNATGLESANKGSSPGSAAHSAEINHLTFLSFDSFIYKTEIIRQPQQNPP